MDSLGLSNFMRAAAYCPDEDIVLLGDAKTRSSHVVAVEEGGFGRVRWRTPVGDFSLCNALTALPGTGLFAAADAHKRRVHIHRMADGSRVASLYSVNPLFLVSVRPADSWLLESLGDVALFVGLGGRVEMIVRSDGPPGIRGEVVECLDTLPALSQPKSHPLAVVPCPPREPGAAATGGPFLLVGSCGLPVIQVISLAPPGPPRVVHTHTLTDVMVMGLAADPDGTALVVCDRATRGVCVLPWPLPGMAAGL